MRDFLLWMILNILFLGASSAAGPQQTQSPSVAEPPESSNKVMLIRFKERCCFSMQEAEGSVFGYSRTKVFRINAEVSPLEIVRLEDKRLVGGSIGFGSWWVSSGKGAAAGVQRLDLKTGQELAHFSIPGLIFISDGSVWVADTKSRLLRRVDPKTNQVTAQLDLGISHLWYAIWAGTVMFDSGSVWVMGKHGKVSRIDPESSRSLAEIQLGKTSNIGSHMAINDGSLWVLDEQRAWWSAIVRMDLNANREIAQIPIFGSSKGLVAQDGFIWALVGFPVYGFERGGAEVLKVDPETNKVVGKFPIKIIGEPRLAAGDHSLLVWEESGLGHTAYRISTR